MLHRRTFILGATSATITIKAAKSQEAIISPPVPTWQPDFISEIDAIVDRFRYYTDNKTDFVIFQNSTCCLIPNGLTDKGASLSATETLTDIINFHPDMNPRPMDDGNLLVGYNGPAYNVVLAELARDNWAEIETRHLDGLAPDEVLVTPLGQNIFDEVGKMALLGRSWMFMDAQSPIVEKIIRAGT